MGAEISTAPSVAQEPIRSHLLGGETRPGAEIALEVEQIPLQDVLGILVMLVLEAMGVERSKAEVAVHYVDHNLVLGDHLNAEEPLSLRSACRRFGVRHSRPGDGISHPVHMSRFGVPGESVLGSDSHTPAAGSLGMLAFGAGGVEVALARPAIRCTSACRGSGASGFPAGCPRGPAPRT